MKLIFITIFTFIFKILNCDDLINELTSESIDSFLRNKQMGFIMFYSPDCPFSQSIKPVFEESAKLVQEKGMKNITFSRVNIDKNSDLMERFSFFDIPSIIWFDNNRNLFNLYSGNTEMASAFLDFIETQSSFKPSQIDFNLWKEKIYPDLRESGGSKKALVFVGDIHKEKERKIFYSVMNTAWNEGIKNLYWTTDEKFHSYYKIDKDKYNFLMFKIRKEEIRIKDGIESLMSYNNIDTFEKLNIIDSDCELDKEIKVLNTDMNNRVEKILKLYSQDPISIFESEKERMIVLGIPTLVLAHNFEQGSDEYEKLLRNFLQITKKYRKEVFFMIGSPKTKFTQILTDSFNLKPQDFPTLCMLSVNDSARETIEKYKVSFENKKEAPSVEMLDEIVQQWLNNKLEPFINSEEIATDEQIKANDGIIKIVGRNFYNITMQPGYDVFLVLCHEKIEECKRFREIYKKVVRKLKKNDKLLFTECNPYNNEINFVGYESIPGIVMFPDKDHKIIQNTEFKGKLTTREIIKWIKEQAVHNITIDDSVENGEYDLKEEINELKPIKLGESGALSKLHDFVVDILQYELYHTPADREDINKEKRYLNKIMFEKNTYRDIELEIKDDL
jgi:thiol-disulfide isomerase/thioredoxin